MKLVLTSEVTGLGGPGDVVEVKDGYGRNYLVPQKLAVLATRGVEKQVAGQLAGLTVSLPARAGQGGRLFGSITASDIAAAVLAAGGPKLDRRRLELHAPIKTTGSHSVSVRLHDDVVATITVEVTAGA